MNRHCTSQVIRILLVLLVCVLSSDLPAQEHEVVRISPAKSYQPNEVSVAINPTNRDNIVAVAMRRNYRETGVSNHAFYSQDGGKTWNVSDAPNADVRTQGDDVVGFLPDGTVVRSYISFRELRAQSPRNAANGIFFSRSNDGGEEWSSAVPVIDHLNTNTPFEDKPWFVVDTSSRSPRLKNVYVTWTRFDNYGSKDPDDQSHIFFSKSSDGTKSFSNPIRISDKGGDCLDDDNTLEGAVPAVGPKGGIYVVWAGPRGLEFDMSQDGGDTWGTDRVIAQMPGGWSSSVEGVSRHNGMPVTKIDLSGNENDGTIYVNWIDERNTDKDVFVMRSRDLGKTWSKPTRVNGDQKRNGVDQFFTWMAIDQTDGSINIVYYDRSHAQDGRAGVTLARSTNGAESFEHFKIDIPPFKCDPTVFLGDYIGVDAMDGRVVAALPHFIEPRKIVLSAAIFEFSQTDDQ